MRTLKLYAKLRNSNHDIDKSTSDIDGHRVTVSEDSDNYSTDIFMTITFEDIGYTFSRKGTKEISYGNWVDTWWYDWYLCE